MISKVNLTNVAHGSLDIELNLFWPDRLLCHFWSAM